MHFVSFCPYPACELHAPERAAKEGTFYQLFGTYETAVVGTVQRYRCTACGRSFSDRTFSIDYYTKRNLDYHEIHRAISAAESVSSLARKQRCSVDSIQNRIDRLGRNCVAMHSSVVRTLKLREDLCADAFESFDRSQYHPNQINILVGADSQFLFAETHATIRRKGHMTPLQKARRALYELEYRPPRDGVTASFAELAGRIEKLWDRGIKRKLVLRTDEHQRYPVAIGRIGSLASARRIGTFIHERYSSRIRRDKCNPLFPVNYYDRELRKDLAAFRRESSCYNRNVSNGLMRFECHKVWHNYRKFHRINPCETSHLTHAEVAGADPSLVSGWLNHLYTRRSFLSHTELFPEEKRIWLKAKITPRKSSQDYCQGFARRERQQGSRN